MSILYVMCGIPGSGKSTKASHIVGNPVVVSSDDMREKLFGDASIQGNPAEVFNAVDKEVDRLLAEDKNVVYDATSITRRIRMNIIKKHKADRYICVFVNPPLTLCIARNARRDRQVPNAVIQRMYFKMEPPKKSEGFDEIIELKS